MFYTYIIYSESLDKYYIGSCEDVNKRINDHLNSRSGFTKAAKDWVLKYTESFETRSGAVKRELEIKKKKSRTYIEYLLSKSKMR
ncbi:hypothetical protein FUMI01_06560 [Flavobacterium sp. UMI-01]|nr:hypothetical protein FUMI01_06560 [Flavobacterium sp. UMI-01]